MPECSDIHIMETTNVTVAAIVKPGFAIFGTDLLDLTVRANDLGMNLTGVEIRNARHFEPTGGVMVEGVCEDKHFSATGHLDN